MLKLLLADQENGAVELGPFETVKIEEDRLLGNGIPVAFYCPSEEAWSRRLPGPGEKGCERIPHYAGVLFLEAR